MGKISYDADFYGWANEQAPLLREGRLGDADIANIAEEIESVGRSEKRRQPAGRGWSWGASIKVQRDRIRYHLQNNPSLKPQIPEALRRAYREAVVVAGDETKLREAAFPATSPWDFDEVLNPAY